MNYRDANIRGIGFREQRWILAGSHLNVLCVIKHRKKLANPN